jgi:hypothetical protein
MIIMNVINLIPAVTVNVRINTRLSCKVLFSHIILTLNPVNTGFCGALFRHGSFSYLGSCNGQ